MFKKGDAVTYTDGQGVTASTMIRATRRIPRYSEPTKLERWHEIDSLRGLLVHESELQAAA